jgi:serpin B
MSGRRSRLAIRSLVFVLVSCLAAGCGSAASPSPAASPSASSSVAAVSPSPVASPLATPSAQPSGSASAPASGILLSTADVPRAALGPDDLGRAAASVNGFGVDLLHQIAKPGQNLVFSPASIVTALAMARAGARGQTATEMDEVLQSAGLEQLLGAMNALDLALASRSGWFVDEAAGTDPPTKREVVLQSVNAPFAQAGYPIEGAYLDALAADFGAGLRQVDYRNDPNAARQAINAWTADRTAGRIQELLSSGDVDGLTRLVLVNAIYMKAPWQSPFDPADTKTGTFTRVDGSKVQVPLMHLASTGLGPTFPAAKGDGWVAVQLPYLGAAGGRDGLAMTVVVPDDLKTFEAKLDAATIAQVTQSASWQASGTGDLVGHKVDLTLPRFSVKTSANLNDPLKAMGMPAAFDPLKADFTAMANPARTGEPGLYIGRVIHQATIDVDEKGTEAAAATAVEMVTGGPGDESAPIVIRADHPFLCFVTDLATGAVLFMGQVADPSA